MENVKVLSYGVMSGHFVRNFGIREIRIQHLQPCESSKTRVVAYRTCNFDEGFPQLLDVLIG